MRKLFLSGLLLFSILSSAQTDTGLIKPVLVDSATTSSQDRSGGIEIRNYDENNIRNLEALMKDQQSRRAKEKKGAMIRIGVGLLLLVVLVVGWRRKSKK
jgi:flagellar biosynthesis/type III secretory pathway M-ring protein FliF/YscJ